MSERGSVLDDPNGYVGRKATSGINEITGNRARFHTTYLLPVKIGKFTICHLRTTLPDDQDVPKNAKGVRTYKEGDIVTVSPANNPRGELRYVHDHFGQYDIYGIPCKKVPFNG